MNSNGKYALVTGGSSGMGLEYVRLLAERGYNVILVALFQNETDAVRDEMSSKYPHLDFVSIGMDLSTVEAPLSIYNKVKELRPEAEVEVLINNAGMLHPRHFRNMESRHISSIVMVHCHATAMMCHYFLPAMLERKRGYILNISSLAAWFPFPFISTYSSTKSFIKVFTRALRTECMKSGVKVSSVYFGAVDTALVGLPPHLAKLARNLQVMITPQTAARKALNAMFKGKTGLIPGVINKIARIVAPILRPSIIGAVERKVTKHWNLK